MSLRLFCFETRRLRRHDKENGGIPAAMCFDHRPNFDLVPFLHGMPAGQTVSSFRSAFFLFVFFFVAVTNGHINLFIKLCPLQVGMYCSDCLQQKWTTENLLLARIS